MSCSPNWDGLPCDNLIYKYFQHLSTACAFSNFFFFKDWPKYKFACFFAVHLRSPTTLFEQERNKHEAPSVSGEESGDHTLEDGDQSGVQVDSAHVRCWKEHGRQSSPQSFSSDHRTFSSRVYSDPPWQQIVRCGPSFPREIGISSMFRSVLREPQTDRGAR